MEVCVNKGGTQQLSLRVDDLISLALQRGLYRHNETVFHANVHARPAVSQIAVFDNEIKHIKTFLLTAPLLPGASDGTLSLQCALIYTPDWSSCANRHVHCSAMISTHC